MGQEEEDSPRDSKIKITFCNSLDFVSIACKCICRFQCLSFLSLDAKNSSTTRPSQIVPTQKTNISMCHFLP